MRNYLITTVSLMAALMLLSCNGRNDGSSAPKFLLLNEFKSNIPEDKHALQYIELQGRKDSKIKNTFLLVIDGDEGSIGHVDYALNLDGVTIGSNGLVIIKNENHYNDSVSPETTVINEPLIRTYDPEVDGEAYEDGLLEHDAITYLLVRTQSEFAIGDDLDVNDDGTLDLPKDASILDSVGSLNGGNGIVYSTVILSQSASDPDAATRFYNNLTPNSIDAWANGDIYEDPSKEDDELPYELLYDTLEASANLPPKAKLSPGNHNFNKAPFILLNEVVTTGNKYIELLSNPSQSLDNMYIALLTDTTGTVSHCIDLNGISAKSAGLTFISDIGFSIDAGSSLTTLSADLSLLSDAATSILLIYSPETVIQKNDDLDKDNNGVLDLPDGAIITDNIGWGATSYSDLIINETFAIQGITRYKDNRICALSSFTYGELNNLLYVADRSRNIPENSRMTPGMINIARETALLIKPDLETERSVLSNPDADDIAFWIHPTDVSKSMIIATQKNAGYSVYDTEGNTLIDALPGDNRYNNVDVMYNFPLNGSLADIVLFTDRNRNRFAIYKIQESEPYIVNITDPENSEELFDAKKVGEDTAYGEGVYKSPVSEKYFAFATQNNTWNAAQFELVANGGKIGWTKVRSITLEADDNDKHAEGIVVDQEYGKVYIAQEEVGIYTFDAEPDAEHTNISLTDADLLIKEGDYCMTEDLEGLTLYYKDNGEGYLFISSQGNNIYGVFNRTDVATKNSFVTSFAIVDNMNGIDGAQHTDSLDVTNICISDLFPHGAFIVQDGTDIESDPTDIGTNFKWISWEKIAESLGETTFTSGYDPRNPLNRR